MAVTDELNPQRFYHGTRADLKPGDLIEAGYSSNLGRRKKAARVYLSATLDVATWDTELAPGERRGRIYVVVDRPGQGRSGSDGREAPGRSDEVVSPEAAVAGHGDVTDRQGYSPEAPKAMKGNLERRKRRGVAAIED